ncbi:MAG: M28 family peptidase [Clostridia bacterium]|nr:M28 family peptidase [Clostridia bacterium]
MDIKRLLKDLTAATGIGNIKEATEVAAKYLSDFCEVSYTDNLGLIAEIKGKRDYSILFEAHIDQVGFIVTDVDDKGFLTVATCGGIDLRALPSRQVNIHGSKKVRGVFCSTPPHLSEDDVTFEKISDIKIDSCLGNKACEIISVGDYVTFATDICELKGNKVSAKSLDDRAGVAVLIELASRFKDKQPPVNLIFCLSDMEELGLRGAKTSAFAAFPNEAIAIDVSFADGPDIKPTECGKMGSGAMIGISPVLDRDITNKLISLAADNNIPYQTEVMGKTTGTDADIISITKSGIRTGLVSIPLRNMHTDCEIISLSDIKSVCDLLECYAEAVNLND